MPGVREDKTAQGTVEKVQMSKISLSGAKLFTTIVPSDNIYERAVSFEFFFTDKNLIGFNSTIEFHIESENGLVSPTYQLHLTLVGNDTEISSDASTKS